MDEPRTMAVGWRERGIGRAMILIGVIIRSASGFWLMTAPLAGLFIRRRRWQKADAAAQPLEEVGT